MPSVRTTTYGQKSFRFEAARVWNDLPNNLRKVSNFREFERLICTWTGPSCSCAVCRGSWWAWWVYNIILTYLSIYIYMARPIGEHVFWVLKVAVTEWGLLWLPQACCYTLVWRLVSNEAPSQGHKNTAGLFSVRILLLLSIFACARSYGELMGIRHAFSHFLFRISHHGSNSFSLKSKPSLSLFY